MKPLNRPGTIVLILGLLFGSVYLSIRILIREKSKSHFNPNLIMVTKTHRRPPGSKERFSAFLKAHELEKVFIREKINYYSGSDPWAGFLKYGGISYQAMFAMDTSRILLPLKESRKTQRLLFNIFNPKPSRLTYRVYLKDAHKRRLMYKTACASEEMKFASLKLEHILPGSTLILETEGQGAGAWINPVINPGNPNPKIVIIILLDTLRADHSSLYGYQRDTTPNLKKLARDSLTFTRAYSTSSWTLPAHVSLFSGLDITDHGVYKETHRIAGRHPLLAEVFQNNGFIPIALTGGGFVEDSYGFRRGFQIYSNIHGRPFMIDSVGRTFERFKSLFQQYRGNDLLFFLHTYQIHAPYKAPVKYIRQMNPDLRDNLKGISNYLNSKQHYYRSIPAQARQKLIDLYDASILYSDDILVGGTVRLLKENHLYRDSMLVVLSDHGEEFYDHGSWEHGHTLYGELVKIPLVIKYPGFRERNKTGTLLSIKDVFSLVLAEYQQEKTPLIKQSMIKAVLPYSTASRYFPPRISFITGEHSFIFTDWGEKRAYFIPPPPQTGQYELYLNSDQKQQSNLYGQNPLTDRAFLKFLQNHIRNSKLKTSQNLKLDEALKKKLKSLGYLDK